MSNPLKAVAAHQAKVKAHVAKVSGKPPPQKGSGTNNRPSHPSTGHKTKK